MYIYVRTFFTCLKQGRKIGIKHIHNGLININNKIYRVVPPLLLHGLKFTTRVYYSIQAFVWGSQVPDLMFMSAAIAYSITPTKDVKNYCHNNAEVFLHVIMSIQAKYKCRKSHGDSGERVTQMATASTCCVFLEPLSSKQR